MNRKTGRTAQEILSTDYGPEPAEEAYRRGYLAGFAQALNYLDEGHGDDELYDFQQDVLERWTRQEPTDVRIPPPEVDDD